MRWMHSFKFPSDKQEAAELPEYLDLPVPLPLAFLLYGSYEHHNVLPVEGGMLNQPRWFKKLLYTLNTLYSECDEGDVQDFESMRLFDDSEPRSFSDFMSRG